MEVSGLTGSKCGNKYQLQSPHVGLISQIPPEVAALHKLVEETERVFFCRGHTHKLCYVCASPVKEVECMNFIVKPLRGFRKQCTRDKLLLQRTSVIGARSDDK